MKEEKFIWEKWVIERYLDAVSCLDNTDAGDIEYEQKMRTFTPREEEIIDCFCEFLSEKGLKVKDLLEGSGRYRYNSDIGCELQTISDFGDEIVDEFIESLKK